MAAAASIEAATTGLNVQVRRLLTSRATVAARRADLIKLKACGGTNDPSRKCQRPKIWG